LTPVNSGRQLGCQKMHPSSRAVNSARELGPSTRVVETGLKRLAQVHLEVWPLNQYIYRLHREPKICANLFSIITPISWSIFIFRFFFVPVETGRNTLQFTYFMA